MNLLGRVTTRASNAGPLVKTPIVEVPVKLQVEGERERG